MNNIKDNLKTIKESIPSDVTLVAVSKTKPIKDIQEAYHAGQRVFGENKIQEMVTKYNDLPKDIEWHMIGHLQRNKVKYMAHFVDLIHGIDSLKTLKEVDKQAKKHSRIIKCLLQVRIAKEETKFGLTIEGISSILYSDEVKNLENIKIVGLMGMASFTNNSDILNDEFSSLKIFFDNHKAHNKNFTILSMGMSGDYQIAIKNGSNMIRIGSSIFGARNYLT